MSRATEEYGSTPKRQQLLVVTGPESSGKTTLASWLAEQLQAPLAPEVARQYLAARATPDYGPEDVRAIALEQTRAEAETLKRSGHLAIADTDYRIIQLWWAEKFPHLPASPGMTRPGVPAQRHYLLCFPDLPWEPDPLRENPLDRMRLFRAQLRSLDGDQASYRIVWGTGRSREQRALHHARAMLGTAQAPDSSTPSPLA